MPQFNLCRRKQRKRTKQKYDYFFCHNFVLINGLVVPQRAAALPEKPYAKNYIICLRMNCPTDAGVWRVIGRESKRALII